MTPTAVALVWLIVCGVCGALSVILLIAGRAMRFGAVALGIVAVAAAAISVFVSLTMVVIQ